MFRLLVDSFRLFQKDMTSYIPFISFYMIMSILEQFLVKPTFESQSFSLAMIALTVFHGFIHFLMTAFCVVLISQIHSTYLDFVIVWMDFKHYLKRIFFLALACFLVVILGLGVFVGVIDVISDFLLGPLGFFLFIVFVFLMIPFSIISIVLIKNSSVKKLCKFYSMILIINVYLMVFGFVQILQLLC